MENQTTEHKEAQPNDEINQSSLTTQSTSADELAQMRDLIITAHPDVVPELITGSTFQELTASLKPAQEAYAALAARLTAPAPAADAAPAAPAAPVPPTVPPGSPPIRAGIFVDVAALPTSELISRGIEARKRG